ncbi:dCTP deaminase [Endomicrobiia bacterium]|uniref:dCTP deaminase n=1 Tax=Endomicrobium trichonymphae TaxID=1408204 RepID=UPI00086495DB|nr:dCTP deaminase [Candidatus Endomicrobium trichonymphae]GHT03775.1 dCTP deaminase [Endomicrobiia bacterium]BAV59049.1 dCTP deaminase [Candidatus Endomicrobium trichonymphae]GHT09016.1 dCTP deaminase [Endomicrobiia bacterium]GHT11270.1 dCTP deaminase [Endomicrobiia bacterium]GHT16286.1 dCTP deaminase [Endomicrobiia bacterium]
MVKNDKWIKKMAFEYKMIDPFEPRQIRCGKISFGTSSYGYDMRLSNEFMIMKVKNKDFVLDPKRTSGNLLESITVKDYIEILPNSVVLGKTIEYFRIPRNIVTIAFGKSTYARCGIFVNITPFEPEWNGYVTLSIANMTSVPAKVYANEGIAQVLFLGASEVCEVSYADRRGKYQTQKIITSAKI